MKILTEIGRLVIKVMFHHRFQIDYTFDQFDPKTTSPYLLIGHHATQHDPLIIGMPIQRYPYPVANSFVYTNPIRKWLLTRVVTSISKRKGQSDIMTIKKIIEAIKVKKRPVMLFPEGNSSFFGEQSNTDYLSTAKLIKKLDVDVIFVKLSGAYLAHPRWGMYRKKGYFGVHYYQLFQQEALSSLSIETIASSLEKAMQFNDFKWNETALKKYSLKKRANGIEQYLYYCPMCHAHQTLKGSDAKVTCQSCQEVVTTFNETSQLTGKMTSLIKWNQIQQKALPIILKQPIITDGRLYRVNMTNLKATSLGTHHVSLFEHLLTLDLKEPIQMDVHQIKGEVITEKNKLSFDYENTTYNLYLNDPMLFYHAIQWTKEQNKWNNGI
jgi:hypothetical protein